jgi:3-dehydroquinate dehydratase I
MPLVCATLTEKSVKSTVAAAKGMRCDVVEVRLDHLRDVSGLKGLSRIRQKVMVTCMPRWEGGAFRGPEGARIRLLLEALEHADYVSVELKAFPELRDEVISAARKAKVKVIVAYHDFKATPPAKEIVKVLHAEEKAGADIAKVAYMPKSKADVATLLSAMAGCGLRIPVIALSMGELGSVSRIAGPMMGGYLTFAAPTKKKRAAPGQYTLDEMNAVRKVLGI